MKKSLLLFSLLLVVTILFAQCKSCDCPSKPKQAKTSGTWHKKR